MRRSWWYQIRQGNLGAAQNNQPTSSLLAVAVLFLHVYQHLDLLPLSFLPLLFFPVPWWPVRHPHSVRLTSTQAAFPFHDLLLLLPSATMAAPALFGTLFEGYTPSIVLGVTAVLLVCWQRLSVSLDPREPPLIKPTIPFIGHIIELIKDHNKFFDRLRSAFFPRSHTRCLTLLSDTYAKPIITLPMLNGKMYVITSPSLIQSAYRNKNLSFEPFMVDFVQRVMGLSSEVSRFTRDLF